LQWQERVGWRVEALPEVLTIWIHDNKVAGIQKLCTSGMGRSCAPYSRAVVVKKSQSPILLEDELGALAVHREGPETATRGG